MPKKQKSGKNTKSSSSNVEKRKLLEADLNGQVYCRKSTRRSFFYSKLSRHCKEEM